jgi:hypothetical protein
MVSALPLSWPLISLISASEMDDAGSILMPFAFAFVVSVSR